MLVGTLTTESDKISSESLFVSIISMLFALTNSLLSAIRQDMNTRDNEMINDMYQSEPYLFIEQKDAAVTEVVDIVEPNLAYSILESNQYVLRVCIVW